MTCMCPIYVQGQYVPCGKCNFCLERKRSEWSFRIGQELRACNSASFLTLTYADDYLVYNVKSRLPDLCKRHLQLFVKRLRKAQHKYLYSGSVKGKQIYAWPSIRYYAVGEYGDLGRPHYHLLIFNIHKDVQYQVKEIWGMGRVDVGTVEGASIHYVTGYVIGKGKEYTGREPPFQTISNRSGGLGKEYLETMYSYHKYGQVGYVTHPGGQKGSIPKYYKDKIFNVVEKERMKMENIFRGQEIEQREIERISKFHDDPIGYYQQIIDQRYQVVEKNLTKGKKL